MVEAFKDIAPTALFMLGAFIMLCGFIVLSWGLWHRKGTKGAVRKANHTQDCT